MDNIKIIKAGLENLDEIKSISHITFVETYGAYNSRENVDHYLDNNFSAESLSGEIDNPDSFFYLLYHGEAVIGYLKLNVLSAQTEKLDNALEIERIYVLEKYQGRKLGKLLLDKGIETARQFESASIWLGVWEKNEKAIRFYTRNNFVKFGEHVFRFGSEDQVDYLLKLNLD